MRRVVIDGLSRFPCLAHASSFRFDEDARGMGVPFLDGSSGAADAAQRMEFIRAMGASSGDVVLVKQVHGDRILIVDGAEDARSAAATEADAIVTRCPGVAVGVLTADCIPVIVYDPERHAVGVVHAGRRGTGKNILSKTVATMRREFGTRSEALVVGMGPGICGSCYEVDASCLEPFRENYSEWLSLVAERAEGKFLLDLFRANEADALSAGVPGKSVFRSGWCTVCRNDLFYSYRKEGKTGRILTAAVLLDGRDG